jgi:hypothetical protein
MQCDLSWGPYFSVWFLLRNVWISLMYIKWQLGTANSGLKEKERLSRILDIYVFGVLVCWWSADHQQTRTPNTHRWHTHAATYCVIIQTQQTQISGRNSNGTKHSGGPLKMVEKKRPKHVGVLYLQTCF